MIDTRITATAAARQAISRLRADREAPVMFVQSAGCCAGSAPMCYPAGELEIGDVDVLVGEIDGCPFYIDRRLDVAWGEPQFVLDVAEGAPEGFSLEAGPGRHFVTRFDPVRRRPTGRRRSHDQTSIAKPTAVNSTPTEKRDR